MRLPLSPLQITATSSFRYIVFAIGFTVTSTSLRFDSIMPSIFVRPYQTVLQVVAAVWLIVAVVTVVMHEMLIHTSSSESQLDATPALATSDLLVIAGLSGLIAIAAIVPGWTVVIPPGLSSDSESPDAQRSGIDAAPGESSVQPELSAQALAIERLGQAFLAGMLIRITGTVALFLGSSYYMDTSPTRIGIWVLGWHLVLLLTEVVVLSRQIRVS